MMAQEAKETCFDWSKRGDSGTAGGAFQWHQPRRDAILARTGIDVWDPRTTHQQQLQAMWAEQRDKIDPLSGNAYDRIRNATVTEPANRLAVTLVERPRDTDAEIRERGAMAAGFLDRYGGMNAAGDGLAPPAKLDTGTSGRDGRDGADAKGGTVRHVIEFQNAPVGTSHRVEENTAGVDVQGPRVDLAMPLFGF